MSFTLYYFNNIEHFLGRFENVFVLIQNLTLTEYRPPDYPGIFKSELTVLTLHERFTFCIIISVLCVLSVIGNIGTLYVNSKRKMRPFFRGCLISLALSDLFSTIFLATTYIMQFTVKYVQMWRLGLLMCKFVPFMTIAAILSSSITLVGIALDRYFAVKKAVITFWNPGVTFSLIFVLAIWTISLSIAYPVFYIYYTQSVFILIEEYFSRVNSTTTATWQADASRENISYKLVKPIELVTICASDRGDVSLYYIVVFSIIFTPCIFAFIWLNIVIAKRIWLRRHRNPQNQRSDDKMKKSNSTYTLRLEKLSTNSFDNLKTISKSNSSFKSVRKNFGQKNTREARHIRMITVIILLIAIFLFLRLPAWIFLVMRIFGSYSKPPDWIIYFFFCVLNLASCALNPLLYTFLPETLQYLSCFKAKFYRSKDKPMDKHMKATFYCTEQQMTCNLCKNTKSTTFHIDQDEGVDCCDTSSYEEENEGNDQKIFIIFSADLSSSFNQQ